MALVKFEGVSGLGQLTAAFPKEHKEFLKWFETHFRVQNNRQLSRFTKDIINLAQRVQRKELDYDVEKLRKLVEKAGVIRESEKGDGSRLDAIDMHMFRTGVVSTGGTALAVCSEQFLDAVNWLLEAKKDHGSMNFEDVVFEEQNTESRKVIEELLRGETDERAHQLLSLLGEMETYIRDRYQLRLGRGTSFSIPTELKRRFEQMLSDVASTCNPLPREHAGALSALFPSGGVIALLCAIVLIAIWWFWKSVSRPTLEIQDESTAENDSIHEILQSKDARKLCEIAAAEVSKHVPVLGGAAGEETFDLALSPSSMTQAKYALVIGILEKRFQETVLYRSIRELSNKAMLEIVQIRSAPHEAPERIKQCDKAVVDYGKALEEVLTKENIAQLTMILETIPEEIEESQLDCPRELLPELLKNAFYNVIPDGVRPVLGIGAQTHEELLDSASSAAQPPSTPTRRDSRCAREDKAELVFEHVKKNAPDADMSIFEKAYYTALGAGTKDVDEGTYDAWDPSQKACYHRCVFLLSWTEEYMKETHK